MSNKKDWREVINAIAKGKHNAINAVAIRKLALDQSDLASLNTTSKAMKELCESITKSVEPISKRFANLSAAIEACNAPLNKEFALVSSCLQNSTNVAKMIDDIGKLPSSFAHVPYVPRMSRQEDKQLPMIVNITADGYTVKRVEHIRGEAINIYLLPKEKAEPSDDGEDHILH